MLSSGPFQSGTKGRLPAPSSSPLPLRVRDQSGLATTTQQGINSCKRAEEGSGSLCIFSLAGNESTGKLDYCSSRLFASQALTEAAVDTGSPPPSPCLLMEKKGE